MRKTALALIGAVALAFGTTAVPTDVLAQAKPKAAKTAVKKAPAEKTAKYRSRCKAGEKWNATASLNAGACEKKVAKAKVKKPAKAADKPAQIKKAA